MCEKTALGLEHVLSKFMEICTLCDAYAYNLMPTNDSASKKQKQEADLPFLESDLFYCVCKKINERIILSCMAVKYDAERLLKSCELLIYRR